MSIIDRMSMFADLASAAKWGVGVTIKRTNPLPLDLTSVYKSYEEALEYASTNVVAHPGQIISVVSEDGTNKYYGITQDGNLELLGSTADGFSIELADGGKLSLKNWGKNYYKYVTVLDAVSDTSELAADAAEGSYCKVGGTWYIKSSEGWTTATTAPSQETSHYSLTEGFMDGLEPKVRKYTITDDEGNPSDMYELAWYQPNPTTVEGLQSQIGSLSTRIDSAASAAEAAASAANNAASKADSKVANVKGSGAVEATVDSETHEATVGLKLKDSNSVKMTQSADGVVSEVKFDTTSPGNVTFETTGNGIKANVEIPAQTDYSVSVVQTTPEGYASAYTFTQNGKTIATVNIPKDMVVSSGIVETKSESGEWGDAGTYIVLTLANATSDKLYINVGNLIEYVTSGSAADDDVVIAISDDHKVTATLSDSVKASLAKADSALQKADVTEGSTNGTVSVKGEDVSVKGLADAAYTTVEALSQTMDSKDSALESKLVGGEDDASSANTVSGAKKYADEVVETALTWGTL